MLALIPLRHGLSTTEAYHVRDLALFFWPRHIWLRQSWQRGDWPFWDPFTGGGQSTVPEALNQFFLPPAMLLRLVAPTVAGFNMWIAAPMPLLSIGTWLWLRRHTARPDAAFIGAAVASLSGPIVSTANFPNLSWTVACIPWVLWSADRLIERSCFPRLAMLAAFVGLQALSGEPVTFSASCALVTAYAAIAVPAATWREWRRRLVWVAAGVLLGVLLSAVQVVPLLDAVGRSPRAGEFDATYWSFHPLALLETVIPHLFGHVYHDYVDAFPWVAPLNSAREPLFYSVYVGVGACVLAMLGTAGAGAQRWRLFWWTVCAAAALSALGKYTMFYPALQQVVPVLQTFRFPVKYLVVCVFALAALAANGADALLAHARATGMLRRPVGPWVVLGAVGVIAAVVGIAGVWRVWWVESIWIALGRSAGLADPARGADWLMRAAAPLWLRLAALAILTAFLTALVWRRHRFAPLAAWTICGVAVLDPVSVNHDLHPTMPAERLGPPEWVEATRTHPMDRVYVAGRLRKGTNESERLDAPSRFPVPFDWNVQESITLVNTQFAHTPAAWGIRELISYDLPQLWPREYTMMLRAFRDASPADRLRFLRRTGTRYCFLQEPPFLGAPRVAAPALASPMVLYECFDGPRRVYMTEQAVVEPDLRRQLTLMFDERHDPSARVLLEHDAPAPAGRPGPGASTPAAGVVRERNVELLVNAEVGPSGGYLNVLDSYDLHWTVEVDGSPAVLLRANGVFRAVRLSPGSHEVHFTYRPRHLYAGATITTLTTVALVIGCSVSGRKRAVERGVQERFSAST